MLRRLIVDHLAKIALLVSVLGFSWVALGSANTDEATMSTEFRKIEGVDFEGVIAPADLATRHWQFARGREPDASWDVDQEAIVDMEARLATYFRNHQEQELAAVADKLDDYKRQYFAVVDQGHRKIELVAMCQRYVDENNIDFMKELPSVSDGGDCFFEVLYDADEKSFIWARVHGEG